MKRTISLLLACALSFSLAACGGGGGTQGGGSSAGTSAGSSAPAGSEPQPQPSADLTPTQQIIQEDVYKRQHWDRRRRCAPAMPEKTDPASR